MKTYLSQIERRIIVRQLKQWGIIGYDLDNAYPQRMIEMVAQSPTAKQCWGIRAKYIAGNGFEEPKLGETIINDKKLTLAKFLKRIAVDKALFTGFAIHVNYNANFEISELSYVKFEDVRQGDPDDETRKDMYAVYFDWGRKTWKSIYASKIDYLHRYNPDPEVITKQVIEADGWDNYKGQLYYFNPEIDDYPLIEADCVWEDFETEAGIKVFNNREINTGFLPSAIISIKARPEEAAEDAPTDGVQYIYKPTQLERNLGTFQGAKNALKLMVINYEQEDEKPQITAFNMQNNDKLFESTEKSVEARIIKGWGIPKELINSEKASGLSNGGEKKEAIREFNNQTAPDRLELFEVMTELFSHFYTPINPSNNWNILTIPDEVADLGAGSKIGTAVNQLLLCDMPFENKVWIMVNLYGFNKTQAEAMVPEDGSFTPINPKPLKISGTPDNENDKEEKE
ncbi:MAG: hypothetical protein P4L31_07480 [Candidatus Babeliales bacterium]|nr:hypothetical protein [Candidatus Babeliales bacterium]